MYSKKNKTGLQDRLCRQGVKGRKGQKGPKNNLGPFCPFLNILPAKPILLNFQ